MKVRLMDPGHGFDPERPLPDHAESVIEDLGLRLLVDAMAGRDEFLAQMATAALFQHVTDPAVIDFRQDVLADCLQHPDVIRALYAIATDSPKVERNILLGWHATRPMARLHHSRSVMLGHLELLRRVRDQADAHAREFTSAGMRALFAALQNELSDDYLSDVERYLDMVEFRGGLFETARLGMANEGTGFVLRVPAKGPSLWESVTSAFHHQHTVTVADRDMAGAESLGELQELGCIVAADALGRSADHVKAFFVSLRREIGFYVAALNLYEALQRHGLRTCRPDVHWGSGVTAHALCNPLLALRGEQPVSSDLVADDSNLVVITGANQGGKSTFLRAVGIAQLMAQCGLFVAAEDFAAGPKEGIFTHFRREEDPSMESGKFDEELDRMSAIADQITPGGLLLCNESFGSTNEREAAVVGGDVLGALRDVGIQVHLVTHQYELAARLRDESADGTFLRAERLDDGRRTHQIVPGDPLRTSYGLDLYNEVMLTTG